MNASNREKPNWEVYPIFPANRWGYYFKGNITFTLKFKGESDAMSLLLLLNTTGATPPIEETKKHGS